MPFQFTGEALQSRDTSNAFKPLALTKSASSLGSNSFNKNSSLSTSLAPAVTSFSTPVDSSSSKYSFTFGGGGGGGGAVGGKVIERDRLLPSSGQLILGDDGESKDGSKLRGAVLDWSRLIRDQGHEKMLAKMKNKGVFDSSLHVKPADEDSNAPCECEKIVRLSQPVNTPSSDKPFRFVDLPTEMRDLVYAHCLVPGQISLRSCAHHLPIGVQPPLLTGLLRVSQELHQETRALLLSNNIIVNVSLDYGTRTVIHRTQLPNEILPQITSLTLVIDSSRIAPNTAYAADWNQVQRMTKLHGIRVCGIKFQDRITNGELSYKEHYRVTMRAILERVPSSCTLAYGPGSAEEEAHIDDMCSKVTAARVGSSRWPLVAVDASELAAAGASVEGGIAKGWRNGEVGDYRFARCADGGSYDVL